MQPIRRFPTEVLVRALEDWAWLGATGRTPLFTSPFGDVFLSDEQGIWFLDRVGGTLQRRWDRQEDLEAELNTPEGQDELLMLELATAAAEQGVVPGEEEVYDWRVPPVLGGALEVGNIQAAEMWVALSVSGQLHEQVKDLPPGTRITGFTVEGQQP